MPIPIETAVTGTVKWFNTERGFGFIQRTAGQDVFFHSADLKKSGLPDEVDEGQQLVFDVVKTPRGVKAVNIRES